MAISKPLSIYRRNVTPPSSHKRYCRLSAALWEYNKIFKSIHVLNAINMHASRLVANCIIAYNAMLLNAVYLRLVQKIGEEKAKKIIGRISPVAWQHLIFTGRYRFTNTQNSIDLEQFVEMLEKRLGEIMSRSDA